MGKLIGRLIHAKWFQLLVIAILLIFIINFFNAAFLSRGNVRNLMRGMVVPGLMMVAVGPLLAGGGIDLAASANATLGSMVFASMLVAVPGMPWWLAIILALMVGAGFGLINVFFIEKLNFSAFIATISMGTVYAGLARAWTNMNEIMIRNETLVWIGRHTLFGDWVPLTFLIMVIIVAIYIYIMARTRFGRSIYMTGGNQVAARLAGLNPRRTRAILYINSGAMATLAGVVWGMQSRMAHPDAIITNLPNFTALTAVIIGGISFNGGSGTLAAGFIGMIVVRVFENGLMIMGFPPYVSAAAQGMLLIVALIIDHINTVRTRKMLESSAMSRARDRVKA